MAWTADILTASRVLLALVIGGALAADRMAIAVVFLMVAWLTDLLDGMFARAAPTPTRLGNWDFRVDVTIGLAILGGLAVADRVPMWLVLAAVVLGAGWTQLSGNPAPAMLLMALAYGLLLALLLADQPDWWWLPFAAMPILLVIAWNRFFKIILPAFFKGIARLARGEEADAPPVLDRWA